MLMTPLLIALLLIIATPILLYAFAPAPLYRQIQKAIRRKGRLTRKTVKVAGLDWPYLVGGPEDGEIVVMVHGFGADKDHWSFYAPHLTGRYRLIAPDLPGFGENDLSADRDYSIAAQTARLIAFLDAMGIERCHLGGNSMGGYIALQAALEHPGRLKSLTLLNNAGVAGANESELQQLAGDGANPLVMREFADVDRLMAFVSHRPRTIPTQFKRVMFKEAKRREALLDSIFWAIAADSLERPVNDRLADVKTPTLVVWGRHDRLIDVSCVAPIKAGIPNCQAVILEDIGHLPMIEAPETLATHHLPFLAKA